MANLSQIEIFLQVVKSDSFIGAARELGMTGPAVSKQVQALENKLGVRLLNRTTRQISLTEEGYIFSQKAGKAMNDLKEAELEVLEAQACPSGPLKISLPVTFGIKYLIDAINKFCLAYPNVNLDVAFDDRKVDLIAENYDAVVRIGALEDSSLIARRLYACPIHLCASPQFIRHYGNPKHPKDLAYLPAIVFNKHNNEGLWRYKDPKDGKQESIKLKKQLVTNTAEMMVKACVEGIGLAAMPIFICVEQLKQGELVEILPNYSTYPQPEIYIVYKERAHISRRLQLFIDTVITACQHLPWRAQE